MKVEQFLHANQFHIYGVDDTLTKTDILQSYNSMVVKIEQKKGCQPVITLGRHWDYSHTTMCHVYAFLKEFANIELWNINNKRQYIEKLIQKGVYEKGIVYATILYNEDMI